MIDTAGLRGKLPDYAFDEFQFLVAQLGRTQVRNQVRADFYDMHNRWEDLQVAIPPRFRNIQVASGWAAKAVDHLARRVRMESFTLPGAGSLDAFGVQELWDDNYMDVDLPQATTSAFVHSPGFLATMEGDTDLGEPDVVFSAHDALRATGRWNWSRRGLDSALLILDVDHSYEGGLVAATGGEPIRLMFFHEDRVYDCRRDRVGGVYSQFWSVEVQEHALGRIPVEPLLYHPRTSRPFGGSRITRGVIYLVNAALRSMVRAELGAEFFAAPQRYALNVAEEDLYADGRTEWDVLIGKMLTLGAAENPDDPDAVLGQFPQVSMQPHVDLFRMWATAFSGETGIPVGSLGVVQDNPSSAEAIYANKEDLVLEAEECTRIFTPAIRRTMLNGIQMRENLTEIPAELKRLGIRWIDPSTPSRNQQTDAVMKQVAGGVLPADSEVTLELLGHNRDTIERVMAERRRSAARETVRAALAAQAAPTPVATPPAAPVGAETAGQPVPQSRNGNPALNNE